MACILQHARDRYYLPDSDGTDFLDVPYWVCAWTDPASLTELTVRIVVDAKICRCHFGRQICYFGGASGADANNQHDLAGDVTTDPSKSSFCLAVNPPTEVPIITAMPSSKDGSP